MVLPISAQINFTLPTHAEQFNKFTFDKNLISFSSIRKVFIQLQQLEKMSKYWSIKIKRGSVCGGDRTTLTL